MVTVVAVIAVVAVVAVVTVITVVAVVAVVAGVIAGMIVAWRWKGACRTVKGRGRADNPVSSILVPGEDVGARLTRGSTAGHRVLMRFDRHRASPKSSAWFLCCTNTYDHLQRYILSKAGSQGRAARTTVSTML